MNTYRIQFEAVRKGAIGSREEYVRAIKAESEQEATLALYTEFDHIHIVRTEKGA